MRQGARCVVIQLYHIGTGEALQAKELTCYLALKKIRTCYWQADIPAGSKLFLADDAAAVMLDAGTLEPIPPAVLLPGRAGQEAARRQAEEFLG